LTSVIRAFRSEVLKFRRWTVLAGSAAMVVVSTFIAYLTFHQIASGATGSEMSGLIAAFQTPQGLVAIIGQARSVILAIALIQVSANLAAEWSQGTVRNLLVSEPHRLRWLTGKMLAVVLFVLLSMLLTLVISGGFILLLAQGQGIDTAAWTSGQGRRIFLEFLGNETIALIGVGALGTLIAILTRSVGAAVGIGLAYILVLEGIIAVVAPQVSRWFPGRVFNTIVGSTVPLVGPNPSQGYPAAMLASLAWIAGFAVISALVFRRQDVTA